MEQEKKYQIKITIEDGYCVWQYTYSSDGRMSVLDIAKLIGENELKIQEKIS